MKIIPTVVEDILCYYIIVEKLLKRLYILYHISQESSCVSAPPSRRRQDKSAPKLSDEQVVECHLLSMVSGCWR